MHATPLRLAGSRLDDTLRLVRSQPDEFVVGVPPECLDVFSLSADLQIARAEPLHAPRRDRSESLLDATVVGETPQHVFKGLPGPVRGLRGHDLEGRLDGRAAWSRRPPFQPDDRPTEVLLEALEKTIRRRVLASGVLKREHDVRR